MTEFSLDARSASIDHDYANRALQVTDSSADVAPEPTGVRRKQRLVRNPLPNPGDLAAVIEASSSLKEAAAKLGVSQTTVAKHARRLGVRSEFRLGRERLPPDDILRGMLLEAGQGSGLKSLARNLHVTTTLLAAKAAEIGVDGRRQVRRGLPDDAALRQMISTCSSMSALAAHLGVADHHVRNQARRLNVRPGQDIVLSEADDVSLIGGAATVDLDHAALQKQALEAQELFNLAAEDLAESEAERERLRLEKLQLEAETASLRAQLLALRQRALSSAAAVAPPETLDELLEFVERDLGPDVIVLPKAIKATRKCLDVNVERLYTALTFLRDSYVPMRKEQISPDAYAAALRDTLFEEQPSLADASKLSTMGYTASWEGRKVELERHLKWGRTPKRLIRVYFHYCDKRHKAVIGWMPTHLDTHSTN